MLVSVPMISLVALAMNLILIYFVIVRIIEELWAHVSMTRKKDSPPFTIGVFMNSTTFTSLLPLTPNSGSIPPRTKPKSPSTTSTLGTGPVFPI